MSTKSSVCRVRVLITFLCGKFRDDSFFLLVPRKITLKSCSIVSIHPLERECHPDPSMFVFVEPRLLRLFDDILWVDKLYLQKKFNLFF